MVKIEKFRAPLSQEIELSHKKLIEVIDKVPEALFYKCVIEDNKETSSVSDIIAYQIGWGSLLLTWYKGGIANQMPVMPGDGFTSWDYAGLAQHFYKKYRYPDKATALKTFEQVVTEILVMVEIEYANDNLEKEGVWEWCTLKSGKKWPLSKWVRVNTVAPYKRARAEVKSLLAE